MIKLLAATAITKINIQKLYRLPTLSLNKRTAQNNLQNKTFIIRYNITLELNDYQC